MMKKCGSCGKIFKTESDTRKNCYDCEPLDFSVDLTQMEVKA